MIAAEYEPATIVHISLDDILRAYFERRRIALIDELREIDRLLGRPQTVPPRIR